MSRQVGARVLLAFLNYNSVVVSAPLSSCYRKPSLHGLGLHVPGLFKDPVLFSYIAKIAVVFFSFFLSFSRGIDSVTTLDPG